MTKIRFQDTKWMMSLATVLMVLCSPSLTAQELVPTSPLEGQVFRPGQDIVFSIEPNGDGATGYNPSYVMIWPSDSFRVGLIEVDAPELRSVISIPDDILGQYRIGFIAADFPTVGSHYKGSVNIIVAREDPIVSLDAYSRRTQHITLDPSKQDHVTITIPAYGTYSDGMQFSLSQPGSGAAFTSLTPAIVSVDQNGVVTGVSPGYGFLTAEKDGFSKIFSVDVSDANGRVGDPLELTNSVGIVASGFRLDPTNGYATQTIQITNTTNGPLPRPVVFTFENLPAGVEIVGTLQKTEEILPAGTAYVNVPRRDDDAVFLPGVVYTTTVTLNNRSGVPISYTPHVYAADSR